MWVDKAIMRSGVESVAAYVGVRGRSGKRKGESRRGKRERKGIK